jgi:hypothetical protein
MGQRCSEVVGSQSGEILGRCGRSFTERVIQHEHGGPRQTGERHLVRGGQRWYKAAQLCGRADKHTRVLVITSSARNETSMRCGGVTMPRVVVFNEFGGPDVMHIVEE